MKYLKILIISLFCLNNIKAQDINKIFEDKSEIIFKFNIQTKDEIKFITKLISIDKVIGNEVYAFANKKEFSDFLKLNYNYTLIDNNYSNVGIKMLNKLNIKNIQAWDFYPTYELYDSLMSAFQTNYPDICRTFSIKTLSSGRKLLFVKISDNPDTEECEPKFLYTSSIHGDELTGYILMLRLIDYLLTNYNNDTRITNLINNSEIWINPLANPDGTYKGGNSTVSGATRYNNNNIDLNRNYPDPQDGQHPDGNNWQPETIAFMALADSIPFTMSANFHGGAEVCNYPFDTWAQLPADNNWWNFVCREFADTIHSNSVSGYMDDLDNGVTNGYAWYQVTGGRQDYMNYFKHCREMTIEISNTKKPTASTLPNYWNYNYRSILNYIEQCQYGLKGIVTDSITGIPLKAKVFIQGFDKDSSHVYSNLPFGNYYRHLFAGNYSVTFSTSGYIPKTVYVNIINKTSLVKDIQLVAIGTDIESNNSDNLFTIYPNPANQKCRIQVNSIKIDEILVYDIWGKLIFQKHLTNMEQSFDLNTSCFANGLYYLVLTNNNEKINYSKKLIIY